MLLRICPLRSFYLMLLTNIFPTKISFNINVVLRNMSNFIVILTIFNLMYCYYLLNCNYVFSDKELSSPPAAVELSDEFSVASSEELPEELSEELSLEASAVLSFEALLLPYTLSS